MIVNQPSRSDSLSAALLNFSYFLALTFPTWGALLATFYMLAYHRNLVSRFASCENGKQ